MLVVAACRHSFAVANCRRNQRSRNQHHQQQQQQQQQHEHA